MAMIKLTSLGRFANTYSILTPPQWWSDLFKEADRLNDQDEELGLTMLDERIEGMQEMRSKWYTLLPTESAE